MIDSTIAGVAGRLDRLRLIGRALRAGPIRLRATPGLGAPRPGPGASCAPRPALDKAEPCPRAGRDAHSLQPPHHEPALAEATV